MTREAIAFEKAFAGLTDEQVAKVLKMADDLIMAEKQGA